MRSMWSKAVVAVSVVAGLSILACATQVDDPISLDPGPGQDDGGGTDTSTGVNPQVDSGSVVTPIDSGGPPYSYDAGMQQTSADSGGTVDMDSSVPPPPEDSGAPPPVDSGGGIDSGGPVQGMSNCPQNAMYLNEANNAPANAGACTTGADCMSTECCYQLIVLGVAIPGLGVCVPL